MDGVIVESGDVTAEWLDGVLSRARMLRDGRVTSVTLRPFGSDNGRFTAIEPAYQPVGAGPKHLLLKTCEARESGFGRSEVDYYAHDYRHVPDAPIPRCFDAAYSDVAGRYHILMEDLSATHRNSRGADPTPAYCTAVADALAALHAPYWDNQSQWAPSDIDDALTRYITYIRCGVEPMLAAARIDPSWRAVIHEIVEHHPALMHHRARDRCAFTLIHGDVNPGNILYPVTGRGRTYLIDRQPFDWSLTWWLGVSDIAYLMVHWWDSALRRRHEWDVLRAYHAGLERRGVHDYGWEQLVEDYRLCAVQSVYVPVARCVEEWGVRKMGWVWQPQLQKAMTAFFDLRCAELWRG